MAAFKLPRLKANLAIVSGAGKPLAYFLRFWNIEVAPRIEQQEAAQEATLAAIQQLQDQQAIQLVLINEALELAGIALGGSSAEGVYDIDNDDWLLGPVVNLTGVVAGDLTIPGTGFQPVAGVTTQNRQGIIEGDMRLVEIVGGVDEVISTGWRWTAVRDAADPASTPYIINSGFIPGFTQARTSTGAVSYRLDAKADAPFLLNDVKMYLYVKRST